MARCKLQGDIADAAKSYATELRRDHDLVDAESESALGRDAEIDGEDANRTKNWETDG